MPRTPPIKLDERSQLRPTGRNNFGFEPVLNDLFWGRPSALVFFSFSSPPYRGFCRPEVFTEEHTLLLTHNKIQERLQFFSLKDVYHYYCCTPLKTFVESLVQVGLLVVKFAGLRQVTRMHFFFVGEQGRTHSRYLPPDLGVRKLSTKPCLLLEIVGSTDIFVLCTSR